MNRTRRTSTSTTAVGLAALLALVGCSSGTSDKQPAAATGTGGSSAATSAYVTAAQAVVDAAAKTDLAWQGPTSGPTATTGKSIIFVAQTSTNPGVAGVAKGVEEAAKAIGWNYRLIDGQGTPAGQQSALSQAIALKPDGIVIGGFDPKSVQSLVDQAGSAGIALEGWHAVTDPGPSTSPKLFTNVTTKVAEVSKVAASYVVAKSKGSAGVVIFTDSSIPFAEGKSQLLKKTIDECTTCSLLSYENIPIPDAAQRTPQQVSSLLSKFGDKWTYSLAINDLYYDAAQSALRTAGKSGNGAPYNVAAGDGDQASFARISGGQFQNATVPEPLNEQGWQLVDEFNRSFSNQPASGYVAPVHLVTPDNIGGDTSWDPKNGYRDQYRKIWGK